MDSNVLIALISGSAGVGGSVIAQLIGTRASTRQARDRLAFDRKMAQDQAAGARAARFEDQKRAACAEFLYRADMYLNYIEMTRRRNPISIYTGAILITATHSRAVACAYRVKLVMPQLDPYFNDWGAAMGTQQPRWFGGPAKDYVDRAIAALSALRTAMTEELGIDLSNPPIHNQPQLNEAPMSGTSKTN